MNSEILKNNPKIFDLISTKEITYLRDVNKTINVNKYGEFKYFKIFRNEIDNIRNFTSNLDSNKIYTIIPFITISCKLDDPYIILSKQILFTKNSSHLLIHDFIMEKISVTIDQYNIRNLENYYLFFKYKPIELDFERYNKFK